MKLIPLSQQGKNRGKYFAKVDDSDYEWLMQWNWFAHYSKRTWYACRNEPIGDGKYRYMSMHRQILGLKHGDKREGDHKNHNGFDNQRHNLRKSTKPQNGQNKSSHKNKTSNFLGVSLHEQIKKGRTYSYWKSKVTCNYVNYYLGTFKTEIEAALAYDIKAKELFGEFANLNFPEQPPTQ